MLELLLILLFLKEMTMKRHKMSKSGSRKLFTNTAKKTHAMNLRGAPMRGGIRL